MSIKYFGKDYTDAFTGMPFPDGYDTPAKSDQIGIPDFAAGAMENWGLVTYRYYYTYINAEDYFQESVVSSSRIIGHELTHQWTGNYVTCSWWDEIWINEAFANLGGYFGMRYSDPDWIWENIFIQAGFQFEISTSDWSIFKNQ